MYVAVKGGERAIRHAHRWLDEERRGDPEVPEIDPVQLREQLSLGCGRVMNEGSLYDPDLAALALKQARGDMVEAAFLLRAFRTTLPRLANSVPVETAAMRVVRRVSATFKDIPGGQILGPTFDYTHRLLDEDLAGTGSRPEAAAEAGEPVEPHMPRVLDLLDADGMIEREDPGTGDEPADLTREPLLFPVGRDAWLQNLARGDEGFVFALGYSTQRGFGRTHPFVGELRVGTVDLVVEPEELGFPIVIGELELTECEMVNQFLGSKTEAPKFTRGYGLSFGHQERKAMGMALVDRALRNAEGGDEVAAPAMDQEFVLYHSDNVQASGFVEHLKLPHYVDFQGEMETIRKMRRAAASGDAAEAAE
ncbi:carbon-phosphorus lyase complex subunit PhnI [Geminicoccus roseus]|uniref:carbon-phosphorus lyase complex subunit PhnI n=1 Tax=Geminicoccus roseus TaxID=404900 RepID=UPI0003FA971D|nr:carbon-phosphorus lyase complex subunit PhnI [Geminicoccus roseus]